MIAHLEDLELYYEIRGSGKPVYLLHGLALDHSIWLEMAEYYEDQAQFIIPDLRGHGQHTAWKCGWKHRAICQGCASIG